MAKNDPKWPKRASSFIMECEVFILPDWSPPDNPIQSERASSSIMECEEFILPDWSPPDNPIQSERAKRASSSIMECEEFILPDWSPPDDPARPCRPKAGHGLVMMMMMMMTMLCQIPLKGDQVPPRGKARGRFAPGFTARQTHPSKDFLHIFLWISFKC